MMFAMEEFNEQELPFRYTAIADNLLQVRNNIALEGMCRDDAMTLQSIAKDMFSDLNLKRFTQYPSNTLRSVALEAIDLKRVGIIATAAAAIIFVITKVISWLSSAFGNLGGKGGAITNPDKVNDTVENATASIVPVPAVSGDTAEVAEAPTRSIAARYITKEDSVQNNYIHQLIARVEKDNLNKRQAQDAAALYVGAINNVFRLSNEDRRLHMLLGEMLVSRRGTIPVVLEEYDWIGGDKKALTGHHVFRLTAWIDHIEALVQRCRQLLNAINKVGDVKKDDDGEFIIDGTLLNAVRASYDMLTKISEVVDARQADSITPIFELKDGPSAKMSDEGLAGGKFKLQLHTDLRAKLDRVNEAGNKRTGMWLNSDFQKNVTSKPAEHRKLIEAIATEKGIKQLGDLYALSIEDGKLIFDDRLNGLKDLMKQVEQGVKLLNSKNVDGTYLTAKLDHPDFKNRQHKTEIVIMDSLMSGLNMASDIMTGVNVAFASIGRITKAARDAVEVMNSAAKRQDK